MLGSFAVGAAEGSFIYFLNIEVNKLVAALPTFRCRPERVVGIPVAFAKVLLAFVTPNAFFQLNESPGIPVFVPLFLAMALTSSRRYM